MHVRLTAGLVLDEIAARLRRQRQGEAGPGVGKAAKLLQQLAGPAGFLLLLLCFKFRQRHYPLGEGNKQKACPEPRGVAVGHERLEDCRLDRAADRKLAAFVEATTTGLGDTQGGKARAVVGLQQLLLI